MAKINKKHEKELRRKQIVKEKRKHALENKEKIIGQMKAWQRLNEILESQGVETRLFAPRDKMAKAMLIATEQGTDPQLKEELLKTLKYINN